MNPLTDDELDRWEKLATEAKHSNVFRGEQVLRLLETLREARAAREVRHPWNPKALFVCAKCSKSVNCAVDSGRTILVCSPCAGLASKAALYEQTCEQGLMERRPPPGFEDQLPRRRREDAEGRRKRQQPAFLDRAADGAVEG